jgi:3-oxoacyl-[acyl-carrier protein] reductase
MDLGIAGKRALVTGGSRGLGRAACLALAAEGVDLWVGYRDDARAADEVLEAIAGLRGPRAGKTAAELSSAEAIARMFDEAEAGLGGPVEILVNNGAICPHGKLGDISLEVWNEALAVNLTGTFLCCQEMARRLGGSGWGRIVNVSSTAAFSGSTSGQAAYDASKGGVISFTISLARELASAGITVNSLIPGLMMTDMARDKYLANYDSYRARVPLGRFAELEEVAAAIVFLCSRPGAYITGTALNVSGGLLMR